MSSGEMNLVIMRALSRANINSIHLMSVPIPNVSRRQFLGRSACNAAGLAAGLVGLSATARANSPSETVRIGVIGVRRQGRKLASAFARQPHTAVSTVCDVDEFVLDRAQRELAEVAEKPSRERDFRRVLEDPRIDAVVIATPDHSHTAIALESLRAGKDVYLETPVCHTIAEGRLLAEAANASGQVVQTGLFDRSLEHVQNAIRFVQSGQLGTVAVAKAWAVHRRAPESFPLNASEIVAGVDYDGWLYPKPERPFDVARFHRGWNGFWEYGSGELGVWGVPLLDLARWGLNAGLPSRVSASGGYVSQVKCETPDTLHVNFSAPGLTIVWEHRNWSNHAPEGRSAGVAFYGDGGTLILDRGGWKVYDGQNALTENGRADLTPHVAGFLDAVRTRRRAPALLHDAIISANYCHLGNLAFRVGRELQIDPNAALLVSGPDVAELARGSYRPGVQLA